MTVNARSEMDLEEDSILDKVAKASGANFGYHKEKARPMPEQGPVVSSVLYVSASPQPPPPLCVVQGSVYKKADPKADINSKSRDAFWARQEVIALLFPGLPGSRQVVCSVGGRGTT